MELFPDNGSVPVSGVKGIAKGVGAGSPLALARAGSIGASPGTGDERLAIRDPRGSGV